MSIVDPPTSPTAATAIVSRRGFLRAGTALLAAPAVGAAACGGGSSSSSSPLRFSVSFEPARLGPYRKAVAAWNKAHAKNTVKIENTPFDNYYQKLHVETAGGKFPDIWTYTAGNGEYWIDHELCLPLNKYLTKYHVNVSDVNRTDLHYVTRSGTIYGLPYDYSAFVLFYNKDLLDQLRIPQPTADTTLDELATHASLVAKKAHNKAGKTYGLASPMQGDWTSMGFFNAFGAQLTTTSHKVDVDNAAGIACLSYFADLIKHGVAPGPGAGVDPLTLFISGRAAYYFDGGWDFAALDQGAKFKWDIAPLPKGPGGTAGVGSGGIFCISKSAKNPDQAFQFLNYITSKNQLEQIVAKSGGGVPGRYSAQAALPSLARRYAQMIAPYPAFNATAGSLELFNAETKILQSLYQGHLSPAAAAKQLTSQGNDALASGS